MPEVRLVNVTKRFGSIVANDKINFTIRDGEYVSLIGPSGCGKTTLIRCIAGIIKPDEGEISIDGESVSDVGIEDREVGYVFQNIALFPHMTVWDNITYGAQVKGLMTEETKSVAMEVLDMIRFAARSDAYPHELSGGTQQKTAVARALIAKARLLLLDEPLGALDLKVRAKLRYELRRLVKDLKLTALHVTHDQEEAMTISDRVIVMKAGRIVESGTPMNLYRKPKNIFTANFVGEANFLSGAITKTSGEFSLVNVGNELRLKVRNGKELTGKDVVIAFRPEFATYESGEADGLTGEVVDVLFSGSIVRVRILLSNGSIVVAKQGISSDKGVDAICNPGEPVTVNVAPEDILMYPFPEDGLDNELALE